MNIGLYPNPRNNPQVFRQRFQQAPQDTQKTYGTYDRLTAISQCREVYCNFPIIKSGIDILNNWCFGTGYNPSFRGTKSEENEWGDIAENWLMNNWFPVCNKNGVADFRQTLKLISKAIDLDGDILVIFDENKDGYPLIRTIPSHRIGSRKEGEEFRGNVIVDGVVIKNNRPIGYKILGETEDEDVILSANVCKLVFDPQFSDNNIRGIPSLLTAISDTQHIQDIEELTKLGLKAAAAINLVINTETGDAQDESTLLIDEQDVNTNGLLSTTPKVIPSEYNGSMGYARYFKANSGEKIEVVNDQRPAQNVQAFLDRIERRVLASVGVPIEFIVNNNGSAATRLTVDNFRNTIKSRQAIVDKIAKLMVVYALNKAAASGLIPYNNTDDWYMWQFDHPKMPSIDSGNDKSAAREDYKLGLRSKQSICIENGDNGEDVDEQRYKEELRLSTLAKQLSQEAGISENTAYFRLKSDPTANNIAVATNEQAI